MKKVLYVVMSGKEAEQRFDMALNSALRMTENNMVERIKLLFYGSSEALLALATGERAEKVKKLIGLGVIDSACGNAASRMNIEAEIKLLGIPLECYSSRLTALLDEGYIPLTF